MRARRQPRLRRRAASSTPRTLSASAAAAGRRAPGRRTAPGTRPAPDPSARRGRGRTAQRHPDPRQVRPRPDRAGPRGPYRPGDRPGGGDRADHRGARPARQEQPRPHRRGGRRQDRHRGGAGPAHRRRRRARTSCWAGASSQLDLSGVVAGTRYRGDFEERLNGIIDEIRAHSEELIVFIDELHTVVGAGGGGRGRLDGREQHAQAALARGELHVIGATTLEEYRRHIEKDAALARRFQPVLVPEPERRRRDRDPARSARPLRGPPPGPLHRRGARRRRRAVRPLSHRPLPARQGDRPDGPGRAPGCGCAPRPAAPTYGPWSARSSS